MFYDRFIALCELKGVKPSRVAIELGFNKGTVSAWKKEHLKGNDVIPTAKILGAIAEYFNVSTDYLLGADSEVDVTDVRYAAYKELETESEDFAADVLAYIRFKKSQKQRKD